ncbi:WD and tetratricopeptide repeats protein [Irineochytrium annulatum]|nr:WD and tetratricopeptide repeats protein [Irineochytrium annulatum]
MPPKTTRRGDPDAARAPPPTSITPWIVLLSVLLLIPAVMYQLYMADFFFERNPGTPSAVKPIPRDRVVGEDQPARLFEDHMRRNRVQFDGIEVVKLEENNRDLRATRNMKAGEVIVRLPLDMMVTEMTVLDDPFIAELFRKHPEVNPHALMAIFILRHRDDRKWGPYIEMIPKRFTTPQYWEKSTLEMLTGTDLYGLIEEDRVNVGGMWRVLTQTLTDLSYEDFLWAWTAVTSRVWNFNVKGRKTIVLLPIFDLSNHITNSTIRIEYSDSTEETTMRTMTPISSGSPVSVHYSNISNSLLLNTYGFTLPHNDAHELCKIYKWVKPPNRLEKEISYALLKDFASEPVVKGFKYLHNFNKVAGDWRATEIKFLRDVETLARKRLAKYPTTFEEDEELLARAGSLFPDALNAVRARRGEKACLKDYITWADEVADALEIQAPAEMFGMIQKLEREYAKSPKWKNTGAYFDKLVEACETVHGAVEVEI